MMRRQIIPRQARQEAMLYLMTDSRLEQERTELVIKAAVFLLVPHALMRKLIGFVE